jgi:hypothetical protein
MMLAHNDRIEAGWGGPWGGRGRLRWSEVMTLISLMSLPWLNYRLMTNTMTTTYFEDMGVRLKWGQLQIISDQSKYFLNTS